jgi:hypothetical protein
MSKNGPGHGLTLSVVGGSVAVRDDLSIIESECERGRQAHARGDMNGARRHFGEAKAQAARMSSDIQSLSNHGAKYAESGELTSYDGVDVAAMSG